MAPLKFLNSRKVLMLCFVLFLCNSFLISAFSEFQRKQVLGRRRLMEVEEEEEEQPKKKIIVKNNILSTKKNQTKLIKPKTNSTKSATSTGILSSSKIKKLNSTSTSTSTSKSSNSSNLTSIKTQFKKLNSTLKSSNSTKKSSDLANQGTPKNKTMKPIIKKQSEITESLKLETKKTEKPQIKDNKSKQPKPQKISSPNWLEQEDDDDLVSVFRDLPSKFQQTILPDLEKFSTSSKAYINRANKEITKGFKPYVGNKYAPTIATLICCIFILVPLLLVSLIFHHFKSYFSLQKIIIFIQVYLSIYFSILCLSSLITGLEPLKFFYVTSQSTYVWLQVLQTLGYVLYLLILLMYLVLVFSTDCGLDSKLLGLAQSLVGFAVGLHYYVSVFHRVVLHQPPKTNWKVHGIYATCFFVICLFARAERRKKAYLEEGGEEGKKN